MLATLLYICIVGLCGISSIAPLSGALGFVRAAGDEALSRTEAFDGSAAEVAVLNVDDRVELDHGEDPSEVADGIVLNRIVLPYATPSRKLLHGCHGSKPGCAVARWRHIEHLLLSFRCTPGRDSYVAITLLQDDLFRACSGSDHTEAVLLAAFLSSRIPDVATTCVVQFLLGPAAAL